MQQPQQTMPMMPSFPQSNITTEQIQKYLDDNKKLILAIMDNQNLGKLADCAHYQALLQKNLMYLAAIADAQPQGPIMAPQMAPHPAMQQGGYYMQHPQAGAVPQQSMFSPKGPTSQFSNPHSLQDLQQQQQQQMLQQHPHGIPVLGTRPVGPANSMNPVYGNTSRGGGGSVAPPESKSLGDVRGASKPEAPEGRVSGADVAGSSAGGKGSGDAEAK